MTDTTNRTRFREHAKAAFKKVPNSRHYALDDAALDALAAIASEWQQERASRDLNFDPDALAKFFGDELAPHVPAMVQRTPGDAPPIPKPWLDQVTGQTAKNPYADDPPDLVSITLLEQADSQLAAHLKRIAGGITYSYLHELRQGEARRARLAKIQYGAAEHERNPFRKADAITEQSRLMTDDPELAVVYKAEAEASPLRVPWQPQHRNMTAMAKLSVADPSLGRLTRQAEALLERWTRDELAAARAAEERAREQRIAAEQRLSVPAPKLQ